MKPWFWLVIVAIVGVGLLSRTAHIPTPLSVVLWLVWAVALALSIRHTWKAKA